MSSSKSSHKSGMKDHFKRAANKLPGVHMKTKKEKAAEQAAAHERAEYEADKENTVRGFNSLPKEELVEEIKKDQAVKSLTKSLVEASERIEQSKENKEIQDLRKQARDAGEEDRKIMEEAIKEAIIETQVEMVVEHTLARGLSLFARRHDMKEAAEKANNKEGRPAEMPSHEDLRTAVHDAILEVMLEIQTEKALTTALEEVFRREELWFEESKRLSDMADAEVEEQTLMEGVRRITEQTRDRVKGLLEGSYNPRDEEVLSAEKAAMARDLAERARFNLREEILELRRQRSIFASVFKEEGEEVLEDMQEQMHHKDKAASEAAKEAKRRELDTQPIKGGENEKVGGDENVFEDMEHQMDVGQKAAEDAAMKARGQNLDSQAAMHSAAGEAAKEAIENDLTTTTQAMVAHDKAMKEIEEHGPHSASNPVTETQKGPLDKAKDWVKEKKAHRDFVKEVKKAAEDELRDGIATLQHKEELNRQVEKEVDTVPPAATSSPGPHLSEKDIKAVAQHASKEADKLLKEEMEKMEERDEKKD